MSKRKKSIDQPLNTHTYRCATCDAEFGVMYTGTPPLSEELQAQTVATIGWHNVTTCGKCGGELPSGD